MHSKFIFLKQPLFRLMFEYTINIFVYFKIKFQTKTLIPLIQDSLIYPYSCIIKNKLIKTQTSLLTNIRIQKLFICVLVLVLIC